MCFSDVLIALRREGLHVTTNQVRWAINSGAVTRPTMDGSLRFIFTENILAELREHFASVAKYGRQRGRRKATRPQAIANLNRSADEGIGEE